MPWRSPSANSAHLAEVCIHSQDGPSRDFRHLSRGLLTWMSTMTSVRRLEVCGYTDWGNMSPLASLPLLAHLIIDQSLGCLRDLLRRGGLQSLETLLLKAGFAHMSVDPLNLYYLYGLDVPVPPASMRCISTVAQGLVDLPRFRLLSCTGLLDGTEGRVKEVEAIVAIADDKWKCLHRKGQARRYQRL